MKLKKIITAFPLVLIGHFANAQFYNNTTALPAPINSEVQWGTFSGLSGGGNGDNLRIFIRRHVATPTDWTSAEIRIQKKVDATNQHFISFRGNPGTYTSSLIFGNNNTDQMTINDGGYIGINVAPSNQRLDVKGNIRSSNEIISTMADGAISQYRAVQGNYGFMLRNDGANSYFLLTASGDQYGTYNTLRPFSVSNTTGDVTLANGAMAISHSTGKIIIGVPNFTKTNEPNCKLFVGGGIMTEKVKVMNYANWADYVFTKEYKLTPLKEVEKFVRENNHLAEIPSAKEIEMSGLDLADLSRLQMQKIEELTLYLIEQNKKIEALQDAFTQLKSK